MLGGKVFCEVFERGEGGGAKLDFVKDEESCSGEERAAAQDAEFSEDAVGVEVDVEDVVE